MKCRSSERCKNTIKIIFGLAGIALAIVLIIVLRGTSAEEQRATTASRTAVAASSGLDAPTQEQTIRMSVEAYEFVPDTLTVDAGSTVTWIVDGTRASGCTHYLVSQSLGINRRLVPGENVITFTAPAKGEYRFSCGMGMVTGTLHVI